MTFGICRVGAVGAAPGMGRSILGASSLVVALAAVGCTGAIGRGTGGGSAGTSASGGTTGTSVGSVGSVGGTGGAAPGPIGVAAPPAGPCVAAAAFAPARLWRLNDQQYGNVVRDVFGAGITVPTEVSEARVSGAEDLARAESLTIGDDTIAANYMSSAHATAARRRTRRA
jgi:hypothetical protein